MPELTEREREFFKCLLEAEILAARDLAAAFSSKGGFAEVLAGLCGRVDDAALLSFGLRMNRDFVYIAGQMPIDGVESLFASEQMLLFADMHGAIPLGKLGQTLWIGVARTYPFDRKEIARLCGNLNPAFSVIGFREFCKFRSYHLKREEE